MSAELSVAPEQLIPRLRELQNRLRDAVCAHRDTTSADHLSAVGGKRDGDTLYAIDLHSEEILLRFCEEWSREIPLALIAEGLPGDGWQTFPPGTSTEEARFCLIVDPIDGTREIMYDKRSAWILCGVAPNRGAETALCHIEVAMMTEIPTTRQHLADTLWAVRGRGVQAERRNLITGAVQPFIPRPSGAATIAHGFASIVKFFPGARDLVADLEDRLCERVVGNPEDGNPLVFDDEYLSTGGQLYELTVANLVKVITDASRDLVPVTAGTTSIQLQGWNRNRRKDNRATDPE
ncbi:MAG: hypothetical protein QHJ73_17695, partial [Armatimonadota bacterium]|nr:hypothetical protein [Armatimonadota bacterium]